MTLHNDVVGCDFCENTSASPGRVIYECDACGADCCDRCSRKDPADPGFDYCAPAESGGVRGCAPEEWR
jgi:hypothetical protein